MGWIRNGLGGLLRFSGRERSRLFWPWAGLAFVITMLAAGALTFPPMLESFARIEQFAAENPDQATVTYGSGGKTITIEGHHPELMPDFAVLILGAGVGFAVMITLTAASVTRRLHDSGLSGLFGLLPLPFAGFSLALFPKLMDSAMGGGGDMFDMRLFFGVFVSNLLYLGAVCVLILLLVRKTAAGPNRYGEAPA